MRKYLSTFCFALLLALSSPLFATDSDAYETLTKDFVTGNAGLHSMSVMTFGPEGILFNGDSKAGKLFALDLNDRTPNTNKSPFEMVDVDAKIGALLGTNKEGVLIHDLAVNPISQNIYLAVSRGDANAVGFWKLPNDINYASMLLRITPDGKISEVDLNNIRHSVADIPNVIKEGKQNFRNSDERTDAITDMAYDNGKLYVAGLSNEEFASALRILDFPFGKTVQHATMEVWHVAHGKWETEAPIRTLFPYTIKGQKYLLAAYTCTPFVSIPVSAIQPGAHVKNTTLGEFGSGNMPIDIISINNGQKEYLVMSNSNKALIRVDPENITKYEKGTTEPLKEGQYTSGLPHDVLSRVGVSQLDNYNADHILALQRMPNGKLNLMTHFVGRRQ